MTYSFREKLRRSILTSTYYININQTLCLHNMCFIKPELKILEISSPQLQLVFMGRIFKIIILYTYYDILYKLLLFQLTSLNIGCIIFARVQKYK